MRKKTFKTQADLFSYVLDEFVEDEETCISEFCIKNKSQAYENLKIKRNHLAEEWNRLTEEREKQIRADAIDECKQILLDAMAKDGKTKCHEYMVAINEMEKLKL